MRKCFANCLSQFVFLLRCSLCFSVSVSSQLFPLRESGFNVGSGLSSLCLPPKSCSNLRSSTKEEEKIREVPRTTSPALPSVNTVDVCRHRHSWRLQGQDLHNPHAIYTSSASSSRTKHSNNLIRLWGKINIFTGLIQLSFKKIFNYKKFIDKQIKD